jgi:hypothetical protein
LREKVLLWDCAGQQHVWSPPRQKKWVLDLPIPEIEGIGRIDRNSYHLGGNNCPCALYSLDGTLKPILSGSLEVLNYWATDPEIDRDPQNARFEIRKILGIIVPEKKVVIEYLWEPISTGIVEVEELIEHAPQLFEYFIQGLNIIRNELNRRGPSWDLFLIEYFLNQDEDLKIPKAEKYWIEMEVMNGEVQQPVDIEEEFEIIHHHPNVERLRKELEEEKLKRRRENYQFELRMNRIEAQLIQEETRRAGEEVK